MEVALESLMVVGEDGSGTGSSKSKSRSDPGLVVDAALIGAEGAEKSPKSSDGSFDIAIFVNE